MTSGGFLSMLEIDRFLDTKPVHLAEMVRELRNLIASIAPQATERILWKGLSYYDESRGGPVKGGICQIELQQDHVRLSFIHGAFLNDPAGLLTGESLYKRYVKLYSYEETPWDELGKLIRSSVAFDPRSIQLY
jgi:hypothetical protein